MDKLIGYKDKLYSLKIKSNKGFSLLEIIICTALFSLLLITLSRSVEKINFVTHNTSDIHKKAQQVNRAMQIIVNDIQSIGNMGCLANQSTIIDNAKFFSRETESAIDIKENRNTRKLPLVQFTTENELSTISIIHTDSIETLDDYKNNFSQLSKDNKNRTILLHTQNCQSAVTINADDILKATNFATANKIILEQQPAFILNRTQYKVQLKDGVDVLYRNQLSSNDNLYSRPLLSDIKRFVLLAITDSGIYEVDTLPINEQIIAINISLAVTSNKHKEIEVSRLVTLLNNKNIFYISP